MGFVQDAKYEISHIPCLSSSIKSDTDKLHPARPSCWHAKEVDRWLTVSDSSLRWLAGVRRWEKRQLSSIASGRRGWSPAGAGAALWKKSRNCANLWKQGYKRPPSAKIKQGKCALCEISCSAHLCSSMLTRCFHWCVFQATKRVQKRKNKRGISNSPHPPFEPLYQTASQMTPRLAPFN